MYLSKLVEELITVVVDWPPIKFRKHLADITLRQLINAHIQHLFCVPTVPTMLDSENPWLTYDPWFMCRANRGIDDEWSIEQVVFVVCAALLGSMAGWGLVYAVQATFSRTQLLALLRLSHSIGGLVWLLGPMTCSSFVFVPICFNTFNWGAEPYDNILDAKVSETHHVVKASVTIGAKRKPLFCYLPASNLHLTL